MKAIRGDERVILRAVSGLEVADAEAIRRKVVLSRDYVVETCRCLIEKGYLAQIATGGYKLTSKGKRCSRQVPAPRATKKYYPGRRHVLGPVTSHKYGPIMHPKKGWRKW